MSHDDLLYRLLADARPVALPRALAEQLLRSLAGRGVSRVTGPRLSVQPPLLELTAILNNDGRGAISKHLLSPNYRQKGFSELRGSCTKRTSQNAVKAKFGELSLGEVGCIVYVRPPARRCRSLDLASKFGRLRFAPLPLS